MIAYRTPRHRAFGWAARRSTIWPTDPGALSGLLYVLATGRSRRGA
jgi:cobalamin biosynthesis protein CobD/CbiB